MRNGLRGLLLLAAAIVSLSASSTAQAAGGTVMGWGLNSSGQLGIGGNGPDICPPVAVPSCSKVPRPVGGVDNVTQVAAGTFHSLALRADGTVRAWGNNSNGRLGNGTVVNSTVPVAVSGLGNVVAIVAGQDHSLALLANGTVMAWGGNGAGQLGTGTGTGPELCNASACSKTPVPVPGLSNVVAIAAGRTHSLALLANGTVMAWGNNFDGETGDGAGIQSGCACVAPTPVPGLSRVTAISAGGEFSVALLADGAVKAWGLNGAGQLGNGMETRTANECDCLGVVPVGGFGSARTVVAGGGHSLSVLADGSARAWGANSQGQLGNGAFTEGPAVCGCLGPVPVGGLGGIQAIAAGDNHSLALLGDGSVHAWGSNFAGELGDGTIERRASATRVTAINGASDVFTGGESSFALVGPSQALKVSFAGADVGALGGSRILCAPAGGCEARYPQGRVEILRAEPSPGSGFAGFSGACTGTGPCQLRMDADQAVTATFGVPKGTRITRAKISSRKRSASFSFTAPGAITGFQCKLIRPRSARKGHGKSKRRLSKPRFSACPPARRYRHLAAGRYVFEVRALDILGADQKPARKRFAIKPHSAKRR